MTNSSKYKIIALYGKSATGKDSLLKAISKKNKNFLNTIVPYTTRPKRDTEKDGVDYYFVTPDEYCQKLLDGELIEATNFNDWFYGTGINTLKKDCVNIGVFNPSSIEILLENREIDLTIIYIYCKGKIRLLRQLNREKNPNVSEIVRRYEADEKDFLHLDFSFKECLINENKKDYRNNVKKIIKIAEELWTK